MTLAEPVVGLRSFLRTPRGVLSLLASALAFSAAVAVVLALNRDVFERTVRERYPPPSGLLVELGRSLSSPPAVRRLRRLSAEERRHLYTAWIQVGEDWPSQAVRAMVGVDSATFLDAAFQTLLAGSPDQRRRAVRFLALAGNPQSRALLEEAQARAQARREMELAAFIRQTLIARQTTAKQ